METSTVSLLLILVGLGEHVLCDGQSQSTNPFKSTDPPSSTSTPNAPNFMTSPDTTPEACEHWIDHQLGFIVAGSAGGVLLCLLVSVTVLACWVCRLRGRAALMLHPGRGDGEAGSWGTPKLEGRVGPCDASVVLEELNAGKRGEEEEEEEEKEEEPPKKSEAKGKPDEPVGDSGNQQAAVPSLSARDSCAEPSVDLCKNLEDMPLMV